MHYRPDVDGLRAFAIVAVVLFHAGVSAVPGGFVGVDIFFVISGYLITGLIMEQLRQGQFSFWDFYARRTRRIYPALFALIPVLLIAGYFILTPGEYEDLAASAVYSSAFLANIYFWLNTGYFDQSAATMPLLHLWSIGVEEQFYIIWPLSIVLLWRYLRVGRKTTLLALSIGTLLLASLCVLWTAQDAKSAFYLPFTRLWEFMLGALVIALPVLGKTRLLDALSVFGMFAMLYAVVAFDDTLAYPGYYAILPCIGAAAVIAAGERSLVGRILSLRPNVFLGKVSYSFYLWHWPIIVYYGYYSGVKDLDVFQKLSLILVAFAIATASWRFIELPMRRRRDHPRRYVAYGAMTAASVACLSLLVVTNAGFPGRVPEEVRALTDRDDMMAFRCTEETVLVAASHKLRCIVGAPWNSASKRALLWGDSHAKHLLPLLDLPALEQGLSVAYWPGCPPFIDHESIQREKLNEPNYSEKCARSRRDILDWIAKTPEIDLVIISNEWAVFPEKLYRHRGGILDAADPDKALELMEQGLVATIAEIRQQRHPILFIGDVPRPVFSVPDCVLQKVTGLWRQPCTKFRDFFAESERPAETILKGIAAKTNDIYFLDAQKAMCADSKACSIRVGGEIIYRDGDHLRHDLSLATRHALVSKLRLGVVLSLALGRYVAERDVGPTPQVLVPQ